MAHKAAYRWRGWRTAPDQPELMRFGGRWDKPQSPKTKKRRKRTSAKWIGMNLRYAGTCDRCKVRLEVGTHAVWHSKSKRVFCDSCSEALKLPIHESNNQNNLAITHRS